MRKIQFNQNQDVVYLGSLSAKPSIVTDKLCALIIGDNGWMLVETNSHAWFWNPETNKEIEPPDYEDADGKIIEIGTPEWYACVAEDLRNGYPQEVVDNETPEPIQVAHHAFARESLYKQPSETAETCKWCGGEKPYDFWKERDNSNRKWGLGVFCEESCLVAYHDTMSTWLQEAGFTDHIIEEDTIEEEE